MNHYAPFLISLLVILAQQLVVVHLLDQRRKLRAIVADARLMAEAVIALEKALAEERRVDADA